MHWILPFPSGRQPVLARKLVSTSQPLVASPDSLDFGSAQPIARLPGDAVAVHAAGSDHRRDGQAVGC